MKKTILALSTLCVLLFSCTKEGDPVATTETISDEQLVLENYADIVYANYSDAYVDAVALDGAIANFLATPSEANLNLAKNAWLQARESYGPTEAFRFAGGPIDDADGPEGLLNAWPLDENYIDYVDGDATSGIVNDATTYPDVTFAALEPLNEAGGDKNISIGYHAVEFLLWGQDLDLPSMLTKGQRSFTDYTTADNASRRSEYLKVCSEGIVDLLGELKDEWDPAISGNYRETLLSSDVDEALTTIIASIAELAESELGGERIAAAFNAGDQEEEHSCFSDNTHRDIILNIKGAQNVFMGTYEGKFTSVKGKSIADLVNAADEETYEKTREAFATAVASCEAIPVPFDYAISSGNAEGNEAVKQSFIRLQEVGDALTLSGSKLGYQITFDVETTIP